MPEDDQTEVLPMIGLRDVTLHVGQQLRLKVGRPESVLALHSAEEGDRRIVSARLHERDPTPAPSMT